MFRCPTCVSIVVDTTVRRCGVCGENFKRHPPAVLGVGRRSNDWLTSWDVKANADAGKLYAQQELPGPADIDLVEEHRHDSSGRTAAAEKG
jgi:hypothetical protein